MKNLLLDFEEFNRRFRIVEAASSGSTGTACMIAASNESEKAAQEMFICEASMMDPKKLNALLDSIMAKGKGQLAAFDNAWKKRMSLGLDKGPLTKKGNWYVGEGAWRINSCKANHLGMTPKGVQYWDPMQQELLEKYFEEDYGKSGVTVSPSGELKGLEVDQDKEMVPREDELVTTESLKYLKKMYESDDEFTLGPPTAAKNAVVLDPNELIEQLVDNFFLDTRSNVMIWGAPGIGKTELVKSAAAVAAKRLGQDIPVTIITLATKAAYDISGIPLLFSKSGSEQTVLSSEMKGKVGMDFAYPAWLPDPDDPRDGILFFDEVNRAEVDVMGAALSLLLERKSGDYTIPNGYRIWGAGNRDMDGPVKPFEAAFASRFLGGHFHLVPTVAIWTEWARTDKAFFKGMTTSANEWYIPDELLSFFKLKDVIGASKEGSSGTITNIGRQYRVKFNYFYSWDAAAAAATGGGQMSGFPIPRTWAKACETVYQKLKADKQLMSQVSPDIDPRKRVISMFGTALLDRTTALDITIKMSAIVGIEAIDAFIQYSRQLARLNDSNGTLVEKIENIFNNPKGPRPLLDIPKLGADEVFGVLNAVEGAFDGLVDQNKLKTPELMNWIAYILKVEDDKKATRGEITQHVSVILTKHGREIIRPLASKQNPEIKGEYLQIIAAFSSRWKDLGDALRNL